MRVVELKLAAGSTMLEQFASSAAACHCLLHAPICSSMSARPCSRYPCLASFPALSSSLCQMMDSDLPDVVRGTAASALCRLLRCQPSCLPSLLELGGVELLGAGGWAHLAASLSARGWSAMNAGSLSVSVGY